MTARDEQQRDLNDDSVIPGRHTGKSRPPRAPRLPDSSPAPPEADKANMGMPSAAQGADHTSYRNEVR